ncbi:hypothetical protein QR680_013273 [Steinernema hermaphroditum]|uniref:non-specific serine/threonine protein kinase n=1 Tax=Steinernema hermaphroditum TaxID=289476 RepID=A0AA39I4X4_9BILA|nr:hypothetical protein QR680_013264 [Steinernema hermaphroditum]KAK0417907.1 hypothetical protein QR680_013273 [Steinernema hermaphroditum]
MTAKLINNNTETLADFLRPSEAVRGRWMVLARIGCGGFGQVFSATDLLSGGGVAIKAEAHHSPFPQLYNEAIFLRELQASRGQHGHPYVPRFHHFGHWDGVSYMVTELCGPNMRMLKKATRGDVFSAFASFWLLKQMLLAVRSIHDFGYLHRDVKPANFVIGAPQNYGRRFYIIDFGLVKRERRRDERSSTRSRFKGTLRYASLGAQRSDAPLRSDDLWSVFYITVENICGQLPWRSLAAKHAVDSSKTSCHNSAFANICYPGYRTVPRVLQRLFSYLSSGNFDSDRDYAKIVELVDEEIASLGVDERSTLLDWEVPFAHAAADVAGFSKTPQVPSLHNNRVEVGR